jgi:hypothetical protein
MLCFRIQIYKNIVTDISVDHHETNDRKLDFGSCCTVVEGEYPL